MAKKTVKAAKVETPDEAAVVENQTSIQEAIENTTQNDTANVAVVDIKSTNETQAVGRNTNLTRKEVEAAIERLKTSNPIKYEAKRAELEMLLQNAK